MVPSPPHQCYAGLISTETACCLRVRLSLPPPPVPVNTVTQAVPVAHLKAFLPSTGCQSILVLHVHVPPP